MATKQKRLRILVVDDDRDGADALGLLLEELGNQVHVTYGGMQALNVAAVFKPQLMLLDLAMPDMDGCQLVTSFRQMPAFAETKIVAITGHAAGGQAATQARKQARPGAERGLSIREARLSEPPRFQ